MTKADFYSRFKTVVSAEEYEAQVLSSERRLLPVSAQAVLDGGEPTSDYWAFLCDQADVNDISETSEEESNQ